MHLKVVEGLPEGSQKEPKVCPRIDKGLEGQPKEPTNSQNHIHINKIYRNSRCTAIQRPARKLIFIYVYMRVYINMYMYLYICVCVSMNAYL